MINENPFDIENLDAEQIPRQEISHKPCRHISMEETRKYRDHDRVVEGL